MNWVGGIRNRVKLKQEKKLQKEFFERKRLQRKFKNITNPIFVNTSSPPSNGSTQQSISQDLLALQVITQTHDKPYGNNREIRLPTKVDLDHPNRYQPKFKNEEVLDLPLPSSINPSTLELSDARDREEHKSTPCMLHRHRRKRPDSYESDFLESQERYRNGESSQLKQLKKPELSNANADKFSEKFQRGEGTKDLNGSTASVHHKFIKRKIYSFQLSNFEDVKRIRQEMFLSKKTTPRTIYEDNERFLYSKRNLSGKQHYPQQSPKYRTTELQSPFIPYAAPAPCSLASRNSSHVSYEDTGFPTMQKSDFLISHPSSSKIERRQKDNYIDCHIKLEETMETFQPITHNTEQGKLCLTGNICHEKISHDINVTMENIINDYPLPSPATNEITIECLNKSDPQSFLTDLQMLEEIIPEDERKPVKASPDTTMIIQHSSAHYKRKTEGKRNCNKITGNVGEIQDKRSDAWKNVVTTAKRSNAEKLINVNEGDQDSPHENDEKGSIAASITNECCSPRRSKIAAEELKEVMAVQQYQSSQESSFYSSWSSTASENEVNQKTSTAEKLSSSEVKKTDQKDTSKVPISQELPRTSTSELLQNNIQKQTYTLGATDGLKHLSRTKDIPVRNPDQTETNLTVFRIYPLNKSKEKSTQTLLVDRNKPTMIHKAIQCDIWTSNSLNYPKGASCEDRKPTTNAAMDSNDSGHPNTNIKSDTKEHILKSGMGSLVDQDVKKETNLKSYIASPEHQGKSTNIESSNDSRLSDKTGRNIKSSTILKLDVISLNGQDTGEEKDPQKNVPGETTSTTPQDTLGDKELHTVQNKTIEIVSQLESDYKTPTDCESIVGIRKSSNRVPIPPLLEISANCWDNVTTSNTLEIDKDTEKKISDEHLELTSPSNSNITTLIPSHQNSIKNIEKNVSQVSKISPNILRMQNNVTLECNDNVVINRAELEETAISLENRTKKNYAIESQTTASEYTTSYDPSKNKESCEDLHFEDTAIINNITHFKEDVVLD